MKTIKTLALAFTAVTLMFALTNSARASLVAIGNPVVIGSWSQAFDLNGVNFTGIEAIMRSGGPLEAPGFSGLAAGWSASYTPNSSVSATGPLATDMTFAIDFAGSSSDPLVFDFYSFNGTMETFSARASWNGGGWTIGAIPVPEPTTIIAGALLLLPFGASTLRMLRRRTA